MTAQCFGAMATGREPGSWRDLVVGSAPLWAGVLAVLLCLTCSVAANETRSEYGTLFSPAMGEEMDYAVYTPPDYDPEERLPLVVLLHGAADSHESFDKYEVGEYLDEELARGKVPRAIIVNPDGGLGFWENWRDGSRSLRDWVVDDLLPVIQEQYSTLPCPKHCHVMGVSMGAHGALRFSYFEGDTFSTVTVISGMILNREEVKPTLRKSILGWFIPFKRIWGDLDDPGSAPREMDPLVAWTEVPEQRDKQLFLAWGDKEKGRVRNTNERFRDALV